MSSRWPFRACRGPLAMLVVGGFGCGAHAAVPQAVGAQDRPRASPTPDEHAGPEAPSSGPVDDDDRARGILWRFHAGAPLNGAAVVGGGRVYVGSAEGYLHALDAQGAFRWSYTVKGGIVGAPVVDGEGRVYVGTTAREIYAIQPGGTRWWTFRSPVAIVTSLVPARDGTLVFGGSDRHLWAVSSRAGVRWRAPVGGPIAFGPVVGGPSDVAVAVTKEGGLSAIHGAWERWDAPLGSPPDGIPVVSADGSVFVVAGGNLVAFGPRGQRRWERAGARFVSQAEHGRLLSFEGDQLVILDALGRPSAALPFDGRPSGGTIARDGRLFVPCDDGVLRVVGSEGVVARIALSAAPLHTPESAGDRVIVAAGDGTVVALDPERVRGTP